MEVNGPLANCFKSALGYATIKFRLTWKSEDLVSSPLFRQQNLSEVGVMSSQFTDWQGKSHSVICDFQFITTLTFRENENKKNYG